mmetsp:Transcript_8175/g.13886  ORF Transcript_8175/g.13886 Transcript_8175/m.13886 type:complete len:489 (+) Transcript_8175:127-1593(+)
MKFFLAAALLVATTSGAYVAPTTNYDRCLTPSEADDIATAISNGIDVDLFPDKVAPDQSSYWGMEYHGTYKILKNTQDTISTSYLLYQCGLSTMPFDETELAQFDSVFPVPYEGGIVVTATTQIPNVEILGRRDQIYAFAITENLVSSPCLSQVLIPEGKENGSVTILPLYNDTAVEDYLAANPDSLILGGSWDSAPKMKNKVVISDIGESPQKAIDDGVDVNEAQAEWLEPVGSLFNQEKFAHTYNLERKQRYECHTDNAAQLAAVADDARPKVLWGYFSDYSSGFDAPASPNYYVTYAEHCQADLLIPEEGKEGSIDSWGYKYMTDEEWLEFGRDADVWIYPSDNFNKLLSQKNEYLQQFKAVQNEQVYDYQMSGGEGWFEKRLAEYDIVLLDMCQVVGRNLETFPPHQRMWLRNVFTESPRTLGVCTDVDELFEPRHMECVRNDEAVNTDSDAPGILSEQPSSANQVGLAQAFLASMVLMWTVRA